MSAHTTTGYLWTKLVLSLGFLSVAVATLIARATPAEGYELSVYTATPPVVWVGLGIAGFLAITIGMSTLGRQTGIRRLTLALGGLVMAVFAGLPIIRGYHFYGKFDALTHLGRTRAITEGTMSPFDNFYPGIHTVSTLISSAIELPVTQALLLVVFISTLVFFVFVPLTVGTVLPRPRATVIGAAAAFLLLPITTISTHMSAHAMSQAVLFSALFVYLLTKYVTTSRDTPRRTGVGIALALTSVGTVLYHPQLVAHLVAVALGICLVQFVARRLSLGGSITEHTALYGQTVFLIAVFLLWTANDGFFLDTAEFYVASALEYFLVGSGHAGEDIATQGASLGAIGVSMGEIFVKLFLAHLVFTVCATGLILTSLFSRRLAESGDVAAIATYFGAGLAGLGGLFTVYFVGTGPELYFRVFGLMMVFVAILGAIAIHVGLSGLAKRRFTWGVRPLVAVGLGALLVLSLLAVFPSPYIYLASPHVTEAEMTGYANAFSTQHDDVAIVGFGNAPNRYDDAVHGNDERMRLHGSVDDDVFEPPLATQYEDDVYFTITDADQQRETVAYQGLRYSSDDFASVNAQPGVNRIHSNGEFDRYYVSATSPAA